jgi:hypothetical protein
MYQQREHEMATNHRPRMESKSSKKREGAKPKKRKNEMAKQKREPSSAKPSQITQIAKRVKELETRLDRPFSVRRHIQKAETLGRDPATSVMANAVPLQFTKGKGSPKFVRITLDHLEEVLRPGDAHGVSRPRVVGSWSTALIEVVGNAGKTATVKVGNALPNEIRVKIPAGKTGTWATQPLLVTAGPA